jgi:hypothetical protein
LLSFFRINDPYRLLILFLAILLVRLPYIISADPLVYELNWLTVGSSLSQNGAILYKDFLSPIAPLSALVYNVLSYIFGYTTLPLQILAVLLVAYQFSLFNNIMYKNKAFNEASYIPAFVYALLMQVFFDFFTLSPALISLTFILLVLDNIYLRIENKLDDFTILKTGFFMGVAVLFYLPTILFFVATILSFALLTSLIFRRYLLFTYGFLLPIIAVAIYYFINDGLADMVNNWIIYTFKFSKDSLINTNTLLIIIAIPFLIFILSVYRTFSFTRFTNYQVRVQQVMFIMFLAAWGCWLISNEKAPFQLVIFVPALAFFISHFILLFKQKTKAEIFAVTLTAIIISLNYYIFNDGQYLRSFANFNVLNTHTAIYAPWTTGKKVLVLGDDKSLYYGSNTSSIKYYNWQIGQSIWLEPSTPAHAAQIYSYLSHEQPETIVDQNQLMPAVSEAIPSLKLLYKQVSSEIYLLKNPTE